MRLQTKDVSKLAELAARMAQAAAKASEARVALKKAERCRDRADEAVAALRDEYDIERLRLWGDSPDVAALLAPDGSMVFYYAGQALAESRGLGFGMQWADTKQTVLHVRLNRGEAGGVERTAAAVRFFLPFVKARAGVKRFGVRHREGGDFSLELHLSPKSGAATLVRMHLGFEDGRQCFQSLEQALRHIEMHHWVEDIIDMPAGQELLA